MGGRMLVLEDDNAVQDSEETVYGDVRLTEQPLETFGLRMDICGLTSVDAVVVTDTGKIIALHLLADVNTGRAETVSTGEDIPVELVLDATQTVAQFLRSRSVLFGVCTVDSDSSSLLDCTGEGTVSITVF